jgi:hypothetical protein
MVAARIEAAVQTHIIEVTALDAYMGNPNDPLLWHFSVEAGSKAEALAVMDRGDCKGMKARVVHSFVRAPHDDFSLPEYAYP